MTMWWRGAAAVAAALLLLAGLSLLGIALLEVKKKAEADKAFTAAKADPRMAKAASLWLSG